MGIAVRLFYKCDGGRKCEHRPRHVHVHGWHKSTLRLRLVVSFYLESKCTGSTDYPCRYKLQSSSGWNMIDTIRGYVATSSGGESARGYRICPMFPGDIVYDLKAPPGVSTERRYPVVVTKDSTPLITVKAYQATNPLAATYPLDTVQLFYSLNNGSWQAVGMTAPQASVDSTTKHIFRIKRRNSCPLFCQSYR